MFNMYDYNNPYIQQMQQMQQFQQMPQIPQIPQMQQPKQQNTASTGIDILYVPDLRSVDNVQILPMQKKLVMVQNEPVIAMRVSDSMGLVTTDYYRLEKFDPGKSVGSSPENTVDYITKDQLEARLSEMFEQISAMNKRSDES